MAAVSETREVLTKLEAMGLGLEGLQRVVSRGAGGYAATTEFHATSAPGTYLYHETTAALRRLLVPNGWSPDELDRQPRVFNEECGVAIVVQTGDENTGVDGPEPTTKHPKGQATVRKIEHNAAQLALFPLPTRVAPETEGLLTWVLLVAIVDGKVRAELSLPHHMLSGRPCGWLERILLPEQDLGGATPPLETTGESGPDIDFDIAWRQ